MCCSLTPGGCAAAFLFPSSAHSVGYTAHPSSSCAPHFAALHKLFVLSIFVQLANLEHHPTPQTQGRPSQADVQGGLDSGVPAEWGKTRSQRFYCTVSVWIASKYLLLVILDTCYFILLYMDWMSIQITWHVYTWLLTDIVDCRSDLKIIK